MSFKPKISQIGELKDPIFFDHLKGRYSDKNLCKETLNRCKDIGVVEITDVLQTTKYKPRPTPLNTIEAQKLISRKLKITVA